MNRLLKLSDKVKRDLQYTLAGLLFCLRIIVIVLISGVFSIPAFIYLWVYPLYLLLKKKITKEEYQMFAHIRLHELWNRLQGIEALSVIP